MKFLEWLKPDAVAVLCTAIYYGVPNQGHERCYIEMIKEQWRSHEQIFDREPIKHTLCIACGEPLIRVEAIREEKEINERTLR